jgi:Transglycosylase SLT domain
MQTVLKSLRLKTPGSSNRGSVLSTLQKINLSLKAIAQDVAEGFFFITHSSLAFLGLSVFFLTMVLSLRPELRQSGEIMLINWLQERRADETGLMADVDAVDRATATNPYQLPKQQANIAFWLSKKYHVAPEPLGALVEEAYDLGAKNQIEPTLILAVMAIESGFNPFAQSGVGAQGLMQVMTRMHSEKYEGFGGDLAAFDPVTNLRVGVKILKDFILKSGTIEGGLKLYVGDTSSSDDKTYSAKVLAEQAKLNQVAQGVKIPTSAPPTLTAASSVLVENLWEKAQKLVSFKEEP